MAELVIDTGHKKSRINRELYGHFSEHLGRCIYEGIYVGEDSAIPNTNGMRNDVVKALKNIRIPVLRWPGGCFADEYHWKDGIGPKEKRKKMINTHWGGVIEDNSFGTHEYMELCRQLGCKTYINGNLGSGTVQEMSEWVEYMTFEGMSPMSELRKTNGHKEAWRVDYFGVGNENWGCGGNMRPQYYADEYRRYQTYVRNYDRGRRIQKIACGAPGDDYQWTQEVLKACGGQNAYRFMDGLSLHYYTSLEPGRGSATEFDEATYYTTLQNAYYMKELIERHGAIMDVYDPEKKIGMVIDEWGTWFDVEPGTVPGFLYQQNTMRDAMVAAINLNLFNKHSDRVKMANIAQTVNVLQAVILTEGERMILTPTYHTFWLFREHQGNWLLDSVLEGETIQTEKGMIPKISESVSEEEGGRIHITLANLSAAEEEAVHITLYGRKPGRVSGEMLTNEMHAHNTFDQPNQVQVQDCADIRVLNEQIEVIMPPCCVMHLAVEP